MELDYLKEFITLAEKKNYAEAAEELFIAQSSLSKHIKAIEDELGVILLNRTTRRVSLTDYGTLFLEYAQKAMALQLEFTRKLNTRLNEKNHVLTVGMVPGMTRYGLFELVNVFNQNDYGYQIELTELDSLEIWDKLGHGGCDIAFVRTVAPLPMGFEAIPYAEDHLAALVPKQHPFAGREILTLGELSSESLLTISPGSAIHRVLTNAFSEQGLTPHLAYTGHNLNNLLDFAANGMGIAIVSESAARLHPRENLIPSAIEPQIYCPISLCYCKNVDLTAPAKYFIRCAKEQKQFAESF